MRLLEIKTLEWKDGTAYFPFGRYQLEYPLDGVRFIIRVSGAFMCEDYEGPLVADEAAAMLGAQEDFARRVNQCFDVKETTE